MTAPPPGPGFELQHQHQHQHQHHHHQHGAGEHAAAAAAAAEWPLPSSTRRPSLTIEPAPAFSADHHQQETAARKQETTGAYTSRPTTPGDRDGHWPLDDNNNNHQQQQRQQANNPDHHHHHAPPRPSPPHHHHHHHQGHHPHPAPPPPPPPPHQQRKHTRHVLRYWVLEICTVIVAVLLLAAIIALLSYYDGRYAPEWPFAINLNSAIAFLSTFLKAAIVAAVAEIIGQIKWTWFTERTRPLHHLQDFDAASRSVLGSLRLLVVVLWNWGFTSAGLLGMAGALVTVASLAVGPVTQQAIKTAECPLLRPDALAAIPGANYVPGSSAYYRVGAGSYQLEVDMKSTMIKGLTEAEGEGGGDSGVDVVCKTGNCTWPDYGTGVTHASIGLCSKCLDTTEFVSGPDVGGNLTLPDYEAYINFLTGEYMWVGYSNLSAYASLFNEDFLTAAAVSVMNFSVLTTSTAQCLQDADTGALTCPHEIIAPQAAAAAASAQNSYFDTLGDYLATSCVLYPCMKEYWASYENNILTETVVRETTAMPNLYESSETGGFYNYTATRSPCVLDNGTWYDQRNQSTAAVLPGRTWANISLSSATLTDDDDDSSSSGAAPPPQNISVPNACLYKLDGFFARAVYAFLGELLAGSCLYDSMQSGHLDCGDAWWLTPLWGDNDATFASIDARLQGFTTAVTNKFRMTGTGPDQRRGGPADPARAYGTVFETSTCTYFDRRWIALPAMLVAASIVLLLCIFVKNYRNPEQPVWKGSVLPLMFFGLQGSPSSSQLQSQSSGGGGGGGGGGARMGAMAVAAAGGEDDEEKDRRDRNATFYRANGRSAPELDKIEGEAGRMWVRFHGGTDPGFVDLGAMGSKNNRRKDAEASRVALVVPEYGGAEGGEAESKNRP